MVCFVCLALFSVVAIAILALLKFVLFSTSQLMPLNRKHVLITGGSSGIGKCCAIELAKRGVSGITLLARDKVKLEESKTEIEKNFVDKEAQRVEVISVDLGKGYDDVTAAVDLAEKQLGPISILLNCAGFSVSAKLEDLNIEDVSRLMDVNFKASFYATRAVISGMKSRGSKGEPGRIVFTSSEAGLLGVYGFTAYSATKFALRGMAESLQMEVKPYNIRVMLAFPPDTDTPGFAEEEKTKPIETKMISDSSGLVRPEVVAKVTIDDMLAGKFFSSVGINGMILTTLCAGISPATSLTELLIQVVAMGPLRIVGQFFLFHFDRIVARCQQMKKHE